MLSKTIAILFLSLACPCDAVISKAAKLDVMKREGQQQVNEEEEDGASERSVAVPKASDIAGGASELPVTGPKTGNITGGASTVEMNSEGGVMMPTTKANGSANITGNFVEMSAKGDMWQTGAVAPIVGAKANDTSSDGTANMDDGAGSDDGADTDGGLSRDLELLPEASGWSCGPGQIEGGFTYTSSTDAHKVECQNKCDSTTGCVAFDISTNPSNPSCRMVNQGQTPRSDPGTDNRQYCSKSQANAV